MYYLDANDQARFGIAEPDDDNRNEAQAEHDDFCPHCHATRKSDHTSDCPYFEEQPLPF